MEQPSSSMKIKSYFASSVEQAIQEARKELGTDAMLITSRRSSPETRSLGAYEVVFGLNPPSNSSSNSSGARPRSVVPAADLSGELESLRAQLQEIKSTLQGARPAESPVSEAEELCEELVSADLARNIAQEIVSAALRLREQLPRDQQTSPISLRAYVAEMISKRLQFAPRRARGLDLSFSPDPRARAKPPLLSRSRFASAWRNGSRSASSQWTLTALPRMKSCAASPPLLAWDSQQSIPSRSSWRRARNRELRVLFWWIRLATVPPSQTASPKLRAISNGSPINKYIWCCPHR